MVGAQFRPGGWNCSTGFAAALDLVSKGRFVLFSHLLQVDTELNKY